METPGRCMIIASRGLSVGWKTDKAPQVSFIPAIVIRGDGTPELQVRNFKLKTVKLFSRYILVLAEYRAVYEVSNFHDSMNCKWKVNSSIVLFSLRSRTYKNFHVI